MSKYGLTCDNLLSADVVTADGKVLGGGVLHPIESAGDALRFMREFDADAPDELGLATTFRPAPDGWQAVSLGVCYAGDLAEGERLIAPLRRFGTPRVDLIKERPYDEFQKLLDVMWPKGRHLYWKAGFFETLTDEMIDTLARHGKAKPSPLSVITITLHHGLASRIKPETTAFNHRARLYNLNIQAQWVSPADTEKNVRWIRDFWGAVEPLMTGRVYVNFLSQEGEERVKAAYGENYDRLVSLKNKYDPTNLFHFNQNIRPTVKAN